MRHQAMKSSRKFVDTSTKDYPVRGFLHRPEATQADALVLTHGAGSNCQSPLLSALANSFCAAGLMVLRCDLPFRQSRPDGPPPRGSAERDQAGLRAAIAALRRETQGRVFLGGHSYGGRQASMLAAIEPGLAEALLLLSYPLHPPQRLDVMRTGHFPDLRTPALFVHGAWDGFGSIAEMEAATRPIPAHTKVLAIPGAGHELLITRNRADLPRLVVDTFLRFIAQAGA
jgi:predicted alpha/beta-hydrolase family hydrolase